MRKVGPYMVAIAAILALGFALMATGGAMISDCSSALTGPFWAVVSGAALFAALAVLAVRLHKPTAYLLVLFVPLLVLAHDFQQQTTLKANVNLHCPTFRIR